MAEERVQRRLAAVIAADVVGYSKMMGRDEAGTLARLKALRAEFFHPKVAEYGGRIVKTTGDGTLIEFPSAIDAVSHVVDVQRGMAVRNAVLPQDQQIQIRLGINVGDIILDEDDIFGEGVNVAARLEALAEPGGICISASVYDYVRTRLDAVAFDDLGKQAVKNIAEPVHVYRIRLGESVGSDLPVSPRSLPLPDKPSIAVLPFDNLSGQTEENYFSDGISEDIITGLARFRSLFVIGRNSSFAFRGNPIEMSEIGRRLGASHFLEGSIRRAGGRIRISAQLIEAQSGVHVWADRNDRAFDDIFAVQDEVAQAIVSTLVGRVEAAISSSHSANQRSTSLPTISFCAE